MHLDTLPTDPSEARYVIAKGWRLRANPTWRSRIRQALRVLIAERSYASPDRIFRCYRPTRISP